ncbi:MAG: hypothetical protein WB780_04355 [Candidatus Acidiferrales bacterium]
MRTLLFVGVLLLSPALLAQEAVPAGTILPVLLTTTISPKATKPGQLLSARVMQDVPLPDGRSIRAGAQVTGHVLDVVPAASSKPATVSFVFDKLLSSKTATPIRTNLRALASPLDIDGAQIPDFGADRGTPSVAWVTNQVGGETVYRGGGHVMSGNQIVGEPANGGVLVRVSTSPDSPCRGAVAGNDRPQALWVFASYACGLYGYPHLAIVSAGRTDPVGVITLSSQDGELKVWKDSGMLLRVN